MAILTLELTQFRNITQTTLSCSPQFNLLFGNNGAGKTSILEAIYYIGTGKSFRTNHHDRVIASEMSEFILFAQVSPDRHNKHQIGLQRNRNGVGKIHLDQESISSIVPVSYLLPVQFIGSDSHRILSDGPKCRRQFLDWGLFHTNTLFYSHWKSFQKILMQRNAVLKAKAPIDELRIWNETFAIEGNILNQMRQVYVAEFAIIFNAIIEKLLPEVSVSLNYSPGWNDSVDLFDHLNKHVSRETFVGHSLFGPQRADLVIKSGALPAHDILSQGQQKLVSYALRLAQGIHYKKISEKQPIYLIDDLPSELDTLKRTLVIDILSQLGSQVFITAIESADFAEITLSSSDSQMFHVKHGEVAHCKI